MTGLLLKDFYLLTHRKQVLILFLGIALMFGYTMDGSFIVGYLTFLSVILSVGSISYDEADNGLLFLMTLPVERRTYALSKYVFGGLLCGAIWLFSVVLLFVMNAVKGLPLNIAENLKGALACIPVSVILMDFMIPIQLKYGAEKSRLITALLGGGIVVIAVLCSRIVTPEKLFLFLDSIPLPIFGVIGVVLTIGATALSIAASTRVMANKFL